MTAVRPDALLETLIKVIDAAKEAGVAFGPVDANPIATISRKTPPTYTIYKLADEKKAMDQASERAMQNARLQAERLATLAGGKLGRVLSVQEVRYPSYTSPGVRKRTTEISSFSTATFVEKKHSWIARSDALVCSSHHLLG